LLRLIQSIPSPKAEPFKVWLAQVGRERIDEMDDPEIGIDLLKQQSQESDKNYEANHHIPHYFTK
jgi:hypothetical protein